MIHLSLEGKRKVVYYSIFILCGIIEFRFYLVEHVALPKTNNSSTDIDVDIIDIGTSDKYVEFYLKWQSI